MNKSLISAIVFLGYLSSIILANTLEEKIIIIAFSILLHFDLISWLAMKYLYNYLYNRTVANNGNLSNEDKQTFKRTIKEMTVSKTYCYINFFGYAATCVLLAYFGHFYLTFIAACAMFLSQCSSFNGLLAKKDFVFSKKS